MDYGNADRWGRDGSFIDVRWVAQQNDLREEAFQNDVRAKSGVFNVTANSPEDQSPDAVRFRARLEKEGRTKHMGVKHKETRRKIVDQVYAHLLWHRFKSKSPPGANNRSGYDKWTVWKAQVEEINALCRELGEPWAWEYLWKEGYNPRRWPNWARAVCPDFYPIINSNATVESLWRTLKRNYLRQHPRASLE